MSATAIAPASCACGVDEYCGQCFGRRGVYELPGLAAPIYHADPCPAAPSISQSLAAELVTKSPLHAWNLHPRLGGGQKPPTKAKDDGTLVHRLLLDGGEGVVVIDADNYKSKSAKLRRDMALEAGEQPVLAKKYEASMLAVETIRERLANEGVSFDAGDRELSIVWRSETPEGPVWCRSRLDNVQGRVIYDLKKSKSAHPEEAARAVIKYGYDIQQAAYTEALERARPELAGAIDFRFVFVEFTPPYAVDVARLDGIFAAVGRQRWERAKWTWARCLREGRWPGYGARILEAPIWFLKKEGIQ